ncbi:MAG: HNH endonuclease [Mesorhizobium sp.]|nr:MAG: HNH endonuclease [Mesorhizobium sp.]
MEECRKRWRAANPEKHKASQRQWAARNPEKVQTNVRARRARKRLAEGSHTADDIERILVSQQYKCAECGTSIKKRSNRQVDHIMPLKLGGSNWPSNLQLLCSLCNKVKAAKHPLDFAQERGRLV